MLLGYKLSSKTFILGWRPRGIHLAEYPPRQGETQANLQKKEALHRQPAQLRSNLDEDVRRIASLHIA